MNFPFFIAKRYLISRKSRNIINIISGIAIIGVTIGTMSLIVVLSVFNGFEDLIKSLFNAYDPDIRITVKEGKTFVPGNEFDSIRNLPGIVSYSEVLEDMALMKYREKQHIIRMKGVPSNYTETTGIDSMMVDGEFELQEGSSNIAVIGRGVSYYLGVIANDAFPAVIYVPRRTGKVSMNPATAFLHKAVRIGGIFSIESEYDNRYVYVPISFAREILQYTNEVSSIDLKIADPENPDIIQSKLESLLGDQFKVVNRHQMNEIFYKVMKSEKAAIFIILVFILIIASFNLIGSVTMVILDKKRDIGILRNLGAGKNIIFRIFLFEGWMITGIGALSGLVLGLIVCFVQQHFGLIKLGGSGSFIIEAYPVSIKFLDVTVITLIVMAIGYFSAWIPVRKLIHPMLKESHEI